MVEMGDVVGEGRQAQDRLEGRSTISAFHLIQFAPLAAQQSMPEGLWHWGRRWPSKRRQVQGRSTISVLHPIQFAARAAHRRNPEGLW